MHNKDKLPIKKGQKVDSTKLKIGCQLDVSTRTIRRHLAKLGILYRNVQSKIFLTRLHKERIMEIIRKKIIDDHKWKKQYLVMKRDSY